MIEAFVAPMVRMRFNPLHDGDLFPRLLGRSRIEGDHHILATVHSVLEPVIERFTAAFARARLADPDALLLAALLSVWAMAVSGKSRLITKVSTMAVENIRFIGRSLVEDDITG